MESVWSFSSSLSIRDLSTNGITTRPMPTIEQRESSQSIFLIRSSRSACVVRRKGLSMK